MKNLFYGAVVFVPFSIHAHDGEHVANVWYQEPTMIAAFLLAAVLLAGLGYGVLRKKRMLIIGPSAVLLIIGLAGASTLTQTIPAETAELAVADFGMGQEATLYKSPNCGCCSGHAAALEAAGFSVTIEKTTDLATIKQSHNIPPAGESCHTTIIGDYVIEGHVPLAAIQKLIDEKPNIAGIGLPGMPIGTPGMPGRKTAPYQVYQLSNVGEMSPYLTI